MGQILRKSIDLMETPFFGQTSKMGQILTKNLFHLTMNHIQVNQTFL